MTQLLLDLRMLFRPSLASCFLQRTWPGRMDITTCFQCYLLVVSVSTLLACAQASGCWQTLSSNQACGRRASRNGPFCWAGVKNRTPKWVWIKIKTPGDRRFWSMFPLARVPLWVRIFDPQPNGGFPLWLSFESRAKNASARISWLVECYSMTPADPGWRKRPLAGGTSNGLRLIPFA